MRNIFLNAPIQNTEFCPDERLGKVVPLYVADWLNETIENSPPVELWNNVVAAQQRGYDETSYRDLTTDRLSRKYGSATLQALHALTGEPSVASDSDRTFAEWAQPKLGVALGRGDIQVRRLGIFACVGCEAALAPGEGPKPRSCSSCPTDTEVVKVTREVVVSHFTPQSLEMASVAGGVVTSADTSGQYFIVNKRRLGGIPLPFSGFECDVADPRIGLGLLAAYQAEKMGADTVSMVASRATLGHNLAHYFAAVASQHDELPRLSMVGIVKAPANYFAHVRNEGIFSHDQLAERMYRRVAPALLKMRRDMTPLAATHHLFSRRTKIN